MKEGKIVRKWTAKLEIAGLIEAEPSLGAFALHFQYLLINERSYSKDQLLKIRNIVSTLFLAEGHYDIALLETELLSLYIHEADKQAVSLFLNWFKQLALHGKVSPDDYGKLDYVYRTQEEVRTMLVTTLEEERKKLYQAGLAEGEARGEARGEVKGQQQTLLKFIEWRFQPAAADLSQIAQQLAEITNPQQLLVLTERFLQANTLDELIDIMEEH